MQLSFFPNKFVKSVYNLDFKKLYDRGYRAVLFDIDNTLVPHDAPADNRAKSLFSKLKDIGFKTMIISNNGEPRVKSFAEAVDCDDYVYKAHKPSPNGYIEAINRCGTTKENTLFIGDQIFTDILGANNAGILSVMVKPILKWREPLQIILKRIPELVIIFIYKLSKVK